MNRREAEATPEDQANHSLLPLDRAASRGRGFKVHHAQPCSQFPVQMGLILKCKDIREKTSAFRSCTR